MHNSTFLKSLRSRNLQEVQDYITLCISDIQMLEVAGEDLETKRAIRLLEYQQKQLEKRKNFLLQAIKMKQYYDENRRQKKKIEELKNQTDYTSVLENEINRMTKKNNTLKVQVGVARLAGNTQRDLLMAQNNPEASLMQQEIESLVKQGMSLAGALKKISNDKTKQDYSGTITTLMNPQELSSQLQEDLKNTTLDSIDFSILTEVEHSTKSDPMIVSNTEFEKLKQIEENQKIKNLDTGQKNENQSN